jgi:hypothetical protein
LVLAIHALCNAVLCFAPQFFTLHLSLDMQPNALCPFL